MAYKRVTAEDRVLIYRWRQEGLGIREVARRAQGVRAQGVKPVFLSTDA